MLDDLAHAPNLNHERWQDLLAILALLPSFVLYLLNQNLACWNAKLAAESCRKFALSLVLIAPFLVKYVQELHMAILRPIPPEIEELQNLVR